MFTGLITESATVAENRIAEHSPVSQLSITSSCAVTLGESIAVNGCCLTVTKAETGTIWFDVMPETIANTALVTLAPGDTVQIEQALKVGDRMGGHWIQGHVDGVGTVTSASHSGNATDLVIDIGKELAALCVERGSIAVDGVSLTVMSCTETEIGVSLIPETRERTALGGKNPGSAVNIEVDILAKYVQKLLPSLTKR